jgi:hypothetical protein
MNFIDSFPISLLQCGFLRLMPQKSRLSGGLSEFAG